jgi:maleylpyruvate isomerase
VKLYGYFRSSAAYRVRIALNLKDQPYEMVSIHLTKDGGKHKTPEYRAVNPQMRVPALTLSSGDTIIQSLAIIEYLDEVFPGTRLIPKDPLDRARVRMLSQIIACDIQPLQNTSTTRYLKETLRLDDATVADWLRAWITRGLDAFNAQLERDHLSGRFCHGESPTMADCCLVPQLYAAERFGIPATRYPRLALIAENCHALAAFQHAHPAKQTDAH